jgi:hypothetical protein
VEDYKKKKKKKRRRQTLSRMRYKAGGVASVRSVALLNS